MKNDFDVLPRMTKHKLGTFECFSGKLVVSDPFHELGVPYAGIFSNVKIGTWRAEVSRYEFPGWGMRCAELFCYHRQKPKNLKWKQADFVVGVDTAQAGIFDFIYYLDAEKEDERFMCELGYEVTATRLGAGVFDYGAVSRSGIGDGGYECHYAKNRTGKIDAIKITFLPDPEELLE